MKGGRGGRRGGPEGEAKVSWGMQAQGQAPCALTRASCIIECSAVPVVEFLIFEQGVLHFYFVLGPINYVAVPTWGGQQKK